jgi:DNA-binding transcriptional LysR family regulator
VVTASIVFGRLHVLPIVTELLRRHRGVDVRLQLTDEVLPLIESGIDVGIRIAHLPDSTLKATRVGTVRRALYASPAYLAAHGTPQSPAELARHAILAFGGAVPATARWTFGRARSSSRRACW